MESPWYFVTVALYRVNIEAATVVTLLVEVTLLFLQCMWIFYGYNCETNLLKLIVSL